MAMKFTDPNAPLDGSLGLIFRLNSLWQKTDVPALAGRFSEWNFVLDRIFSNLLYKNQLDPVIADGKITDVQLSEEDLKMYRILNNKILQAQKLLREAHGRKEYDDANSKLYFAIFMKEVGLRKFQHKLKLYTKEHSGNPATSMWGGK